MSKKGSINYSRIVKAIDGLSKEQLADLRTEIDRNIASKWKPQDYQTHLESRLIEVSNDRDHLKQVLNALIKKSNQQAAVLRHLEKNGAIKTEDEHDLT